MGRFTNVGSVRSLCRGVAACEGCVETQVPGPLLVGVVAAEGERSSPGTMAESGGADGSLGWSPLFSGDCVTPSFPGHLLGVSVVPWRSLC